MARSSFHDLYNGPVERSAASGRARVHFGQLKGPCVEFIAGSDIVVGAVAWLTDQDIIAALAGRFVAIVVQKENWWKKGDARGVKLATGYVGLTGGLPAYAFPEPLASLGDVELAAISCMGTTGGGNGYGSPFMHHKFLVRCTAVDGTLVPQAVWTGSFNLSGNANSSFENAVVLDDPELAAAYLAEFALVASLSEPMNWRSAAVSPGGLGSALRVPKARQKGSRKRR